jgi:exosome complex component RRP42
VRVIESGRTGEYELELTDDPDDCVKVDVEKVPIFVSFSHIEGFPVVDPSMEEELCRGCRTTLGVNKMGNICSIDKGTGALALNALSELTLAATKIGTKLIEEIDALLAEESQGKTVKRGFSKK